MTASERDVRIVPGEALRFRVPSRTESDSHLVDLGQFAGNGQCDCLDFTMRKQPRLMRGAKPSRELECWHIKLAKRAFCQRMIAEVMKSRGDRQERKGGP